MSVMEEGYRKGKELKNVEIALQRSRNAGPLAEESLNLLLDWREANMTEKPTDLVFAALVRSLTPEQQHALTEVLEMVEEGKAFRLF